MEKSNHNDIIRQASRYTMHGLIDPRLLEPANPISKDNNLLNKVIALVSRIVLKKTTA